MEQYGMMTVERYIREGLPPGVQAWFEFRGKAAWLNYIRSDGGALRFFGQHPETGKRVSLTIAGLLDTPLYLSVTSISGMDIQDVIAQARIIPRDLQRVAACQTNQEPADGTLVPSGQWHG
jgi:hypothetical protein